MLPGDNGGDGGDGGGEGGCGGEIIDGNSDDGDSDELL